MLKADFIPNAKKKKLSKKIVSLNLEIINNIYFFIIPYNYLLPAKALDISWTIF